MLLSNSISRLIGYFKRHGIRATLDRAELALRRLYSAGRMVIYYCDLPIRGIPASMLDQREGLSVERKNGQQEIEERDLDRILNYWNPKLARRQLEERFGTGAVLWLVRSGEEVAGYGWTLTGKTIRGYFVPLGPDDVHLFDFLVFPEYRGRQMNPFLVSHILGCLVQEKKSRAYIEVAEWNEAELKSLRRTTFHLFGRARKASLFGRTIVEWRTQNPQNQDAEREQSIS